MTSTATATSQGTLGLSFGEYTTNTPLQSIILDVVDSIIGQDSTDRGAWDYVVMRRVSLDSAYSLHEVEREIQRLLKADKLYESCYEILDGILFMTYLRDSSELLGSATSEIEAEQDKSEV